MTAIVGVLLLVDRQLLGLLELIWWIIPLPMVLYSAKYGWKDSLVPFFAIVFLAFLFGGITTIFIVPMMTLCGVFYGDAVKKKATSRKLIWLSIGFYTISSAIVMVLFAGVFGYDIMKEIGTLQEMMSTMQVSMDSFSADVDGILLQLYIVSVIFSGIFEGIIMHICSKFILRRMGYCVSPPRALLTIAIPKWTGYVALLLWQVGYYAMRIPLENVKFQNGLIVAMVLSMMYLFYFGLFAVMVWLKIKVKRKEIVLLSFIVIILMFQWFLIFLSFVGFLYITTNWRENYLRRIYHE